MTKPTVSRQRKWQLAKKNQGKCMTCGEDRNNDNASYCEPCRKKRNQQQRDRSTFTGSIWD